MQAVCRFAYNLFNSCIVIVSLNHTNLRANTPWYHGRTTHGRFLLGRSPQTDPYHARLQVHLAPMSRGLCVLELGESAIYLRETAVACARNGSFHGGS